MKKNLLTTISFILRITNKLFLIFIEFISMHFTSWKKPDFYNIRNDDSIEKKRILIIRHGGIGDLLFISAILKKIKITNSKITIILMTKRRYHGLFKNLEYVDKIVNYTWLNIKLLIKSDNVLFLDNSIETDPDAKYFNIYDLFSKKYVELEDSEKHPVVSINEVNISYLFEKLPFLSDAKLCIGIQLFAGSPVRTPSLKFWIKIIGIVLKEFPKSHIILICDNRKKDKANYIINTFSHSSVARKIINFGKFSRNIEDLVALIPFMDLIIAPDSSVIHLAGSFFVPSIGIYGPFPSELRTKYYINNDSIDAEISCSPCFTHGHRPCKIAIKDKKKYSPCFDAIELSKIRNILKNKKNVISNKRVKFISAINISVYKNEECYIIGKGPSFDNVDLDILSDKLTICINETFKFVPNPKFVFYHDAFFKKDIEYIKSSKAKFVIPYLLNKKYDEKILSLNYINLNEYNNIYSYYKFPIDINNLKNFNYLDPNNVLVGISGTIHSAIHFVYKIGVKKINFIGIDGYDSGNIYAKNFIPEYVNNLSSNNYNKIKNDAIILLEFLKLDYEFLGGKN